jgi:hypothetical protein
MAKCLLVDRGRSVTHIGLGDLVPTGGQPALGEIGSDARGDGNGTEVTDESLDLSSDVHQQKTSRFRKRELAFLPYRSWC